MLNSPTQRWGAAGAGACLLLTFAGWFFVVGPAQTQATSNWAELEGAEGQTAASADSSQRVGGPVRGDRRGSGRARQQRQSLPATNSLDALVRALNQAAAATGVTVDAVVPEPPIDITPVAPEAPDDPEAEEEDPPPRSAAGGRAVEPEVAVWPLFELPVTVRVTGSMVAVQNFMRVVQTEQPRAILFTSFVLAPNLDSLVGAGLFTLSAETTCSSAR